MAKHKLVLELARQATNEILDQNNDIGLNLFLWARFLQGVFVLDTTDIVAVNNDIKIPEVSFHCYLDNHQTSGCAQSLCTVVVVQVAVLNARTSGLLARAILREDNIIQTQLGCNLAHVGFVMNERQHTRYCGMSNPLAVAVTLEVLPEEQVWPRVKGAKEGHVWLQGSWDWSCQEEGNTPLVKDVDTHKVSFVKIFNDLFLLFVSWTMTTMFLRQARADVVGDVTLVVIDLRLISLDKLDIVAGRHHQVVAKR